MRLLLAIGLCRGMNVFNFRELDSNPVIPHTGPRQEIIDGAEAQDEHLRDGAEAAGTAAAQG